MAWIGEREGAYQRAKRQRKTRKKLEIWKRERKNRLRKLIKKSGENKPEDTSFEEAAVNIFIFYNEYRDAENLVICSRAGKIIAMTNKVFPDGEYHIEYPQELR